VSVCEFFKVPFERVLGKELKKNQHGQTGFWVKRTNPTSRLLY